MPHWLTQLLYLAAAVLFIVGLKRLNTPATARRGNLISGAGMLLAIVVTLLDLGQVNYTVIIAGVVVGSALGLVAALSVQMTAMPQMVALLNGFGGGASMVVGAAEFLRLYQVGENIATPTVTVMQLSLIIGAVTFSGSVIAFAKLQELMAGRPITYAGQQFVNGLLFLVLVGLAGWAGGDGSAPPRAALWRDRAGAGAGRAARHPDWRRGHAGGDLAPELPTLA